MEMVNSRSPICYIRRYDSMVAGVRLVMTTSITLQVFSTSEPPKRASEKGEKRRRENDDIQLRAEPGSP
jgi:hypothetical protein